MKWVEIINLRSPGKMNAEIVDELLKGVGEPGSPTDAPRRLSEIKIYHHSVVETDLSIHIYWESEEGIQHKSHLGLRIFSALRSMGLLNHSVWIETAALEFPQLTPKSEIRTITNQERKEEETMEQEKKEAQVKMETLEVQLKEWGFDLEKFRAKADNTKGKAKAELEREMVGLRAKLNEAQEKAEELKREGDAASGELKKGIENARTELKKAFDSATAKFK